MSYLREIAIPHGHTTVEFGMKSFRILCTLVLSLCFAASIAHGANPQKESKMKDVLVSPDMVDFKLIKVGKAGAQIMSITNKGKAPVTLKSAKKIKTPFSVDGKFPRTLEPGKTADVKIIFKRQKPEEYKGPVKLVVSPQGDLQILPAK